MHVTPCTVLASPLYSCPYFAIASSLKRLNYRKDGRVEKFLCVRFTKWIACLIYQNIVIHVYVLMFGRWSFYIWCGSIAVVNSFLMYSDQTCKTIKIHMTHTNTHNIYKCTQYTYKHTQTQANTHTCMSTHRHMHTDTNIHTHTNTHTHKGKVQIITVTYYNNYGDGCSAQNRQVIKGLWLALLHSYSVCTMYSA